MKNINLHTIVLLTALFITACSNKGNVSSESQSAAFLSGSTVSYAVPELMERDKNLAYEEYLKIKEKYDKMSANYQADNADFESLLKLSEIYVFEARVTGEHPYYYNAALNTLNELLRNGNALTKDQKFTALFYKATVQLSQHNFNEALATAEKALELNPYNAGIYGVLVDANVEIGNYEEAVKMCDKMISIRPDLRSYSRTSYLREIYGDINGSKRAMVMAIKAGAPYSEYKCWAITTLGKMYESEAKLDSAIYCYETALEEREKYPFAIAGIASVRAKQGKTEEAIKLYEEAIAIIPEIGFNMDLAGLKKEEASEAYLQEMTDEIETMFKEDIESGHNMNLEYAAFLSSFKEDHEAALNYALIEYKNRPKNIDVNKELAFIYYQLDQPENAKVHYKLATATGRQDADLVCLGGLLESDTRTIKSAFAMNPYQDHSLVAQAQEMLD